MGSFSIMHWLIVLVVVVLIFGTKKLGSVGGDLGKAVRGFKEGMSGKPEEEMKALASSDQTASETEQQKKS